MFRNRGRVRVSILDGTMMFAKAFVKMSFSLPNVLARQVTCSAFFTFSRSVYFFTSNVLLIQLYSRSGNSQRLVAVVLPVYKVIAA